MKYQIEATENGYKITALFPTPRAKLRGISLETEGGHDELEELYKHMEDVWSDLREAFRLNSFKREGD